MCQTRNARRVARTPRHSLLALFPVCCCACGSQTTSSVLVPVRADLGAAGQGVQNARALVLWVSGVGRLVPLLARLCPVGQEPAFVGRLSQHGARHIQAQKDAPTLGMLNPPFVYLAVPFFVASAVLRLYCLACAAVPVRVI